MQNFLQTALPTACRAGAEILKIYRDGFEAKEKADGSAVTEADEKAEKLICEALNASFPDIPVLAEEAASRGEVPTLGERFILVDPLDGTREFVNRTAEFTVNIALIERGRPIAGVVLAPAMATVWYGDGDGAFKQSLDETSCELIGSPTRIRTRPIPGSDLIAVASRSHRSAETESLLAKLGASDFKPAGSSLKFCLVAEGQADVYPRLGRTMEWDTGAGQAVLEAAGGRVNELHEMDEGEPLLYGKSARGYDNPHFIAWGG